MINPGNTSFETVKKTIIKATSETALAVRNLILEKGFSPTDQLTDEQSRVREREIDQAGVDVMSKSLKDAPFKLEIVGSEGKKHIFDYSGTNHDQLPAQLLLEWPVMTYGVVNEKALLLGQGLVFSLYLSLGIPKRAE